MKSTKVVRVAVIGGGAVAQARHLPEYAANPNAEIAGIFDFNVERSRELCERYGGRAYSSLEEALEDETVNAVSICTPNVNMRNTRSVLLKPESMFWWKSLWR